jgi:hypothetical protein
VGFVWLVMLWKKAASDAQWCGRWRGHRARPYANVPRPAAQVSSLVNAAGSAQRSACVEAQRRSTEGTAEPALPGRQYRPLEGVTPKAARGCFRMLGAGGRLSVRNAHSQAYLLLRKLFFISLSNGCNLAPPMRRARQVATTSITIRCIKREVMGLYRS